jgi:hypothetical protein
VANASPVLGSITAEVRPPRVSTYSPAMKLRSARGAVVAVGPEVWAAVIAGLLNVEREPVGSGTAA